MADFIFLGLDEILEIHLDQVQRYGGSAELRDLDLLQSATAMPQATFEGRYLHEDIFAMAAAYLYHITQNHPFVDGNKRTGAVASIVFLALNNIQVGASEAELEDLVWNVAKGGTDKETIAAFFRQRCGS